jgi:hypothetical protein
MSTKIVIFNVETGGLSGAAERAAKILDDFFAPRAAIRKAQADVEVARLETQREIERRRGAYEVASVEFRAQARFAEEQVRHQENMERIASLALREIPEGAQVDQVEHDWLSHFFERCRNVTNEEMQAMWSKVLAGELSQPGSFSHKTIDVVGTLDKEAAHAFTALCSFVWTIDGMPCCFVYEPGHQTLTEAGIGFSDALALSDLGLVRVQLVDGTSFTSTVHGEPTASASYYGRSYRLKPRGAFNLGRVSLTQAGAELFAIAGGNARETCFEKVLSCWRNFGYKPEVEEGGSAAL